MGPQADSRRTRTPEETRFEAFLRTRKLKLTRERLVILAAIFRQEHHFDAESLHADLRTEGGDISRATVYRTLDLLVQAGLVRKNSLGASHAVLKLQGSGTPCMGSIMNGVNLKSVANYYYYRRYGGYAYRHYQSHPADASPPAQG